MNMMNFILESQKAFGQETTVGNVGKFIICESGETLRKCVRDEALAADKFEDIIFS